MEIRPRLTFGFGAPVAACALKYLLMPFFAFSFRSRSSSRFLLAVYRVSAFDQNAQRDQE